MSFTLKVAETSPKFVGRGIALVDPKVMEEERLTTGADIAALVNAAAMAAIKEQISAGGKGRIRITKSHSEKALQKVKRKGGIVRGALA